MRVSATTSCRRRVYEEEEDQATKEVNADRNGEKYDILQKPTPLDKWWQVAELIICNRPASPSAAFSI